MKKIAHWLVWVGGLLGGVFALIAVKHYLALQGGDLGFNSFCNINSTFNCDLVTLSSYSAYWGVPSAGLGFLFFVAQLALGIWWRFSGEDRAATVGFFLSLIGLVFSAYLVWVMLWVLQVYCITCLTMDFAQLIILLGWLISGGVNMKIFSEPKRLLAPFAMVLAIFLVGVAFLSNLTEAIAKNQPSPEIIAQAVNSFSKQKPIELEVNIADHPGWGEEGVENPAAVLIEFSDFECPYCRVAAQIVKPFLAELKRDVRFVFINYPLDKSCNEGMQRELHKNACLAAKAALCAQESGKFWEMHDQLFENQAQLSEAKILEIANKQKLNKEEFSVCLQSEETTAKVKRDIALGAKAGVSGTPTFILNGKVLQGWKYKEFLRAAIRAEVQRKKGN